LEGAFWEASSDESAMKVRRGGATVAYSPSYLEVVFSEVGKKLPKHLPKTLASQRSS
jgi:hypothetical protein